MISTSAYDHPPELEGNFLGKNTHPRFISRVKFTIVSFFCVKIYNTIVDAFDFSQCYNQGAKL